jgi:hypothetical protein
VDITIVIDRIKMKKAFIYWFSLSNTSTHLKRTLIGLSRSLTLKFLHRIMPQPGPIVIDNPLRHVLEAANSIYLGDQRGRFGFNHLTSLGTGIEFDSSKYKAVVTRTRIVARYAFG